MNEIPLLDSMNLDQDTLLSPDGYVSWAKKIKGIEDASVPLCCLFAFDSEVIPFFASKHNVTNHMNWIGFHSSVLKCLTADGLEFGIVTKTVGAPFAAMTMEELIECGARYFLSFGSGGLLRSDLKPPWYIVPTAAIRDEGTSFHYMPPSRSIELEEDTTSLLIKICAEKGVIPYSGITWTTDALYRETVDRSRKFVEDGVLVAEMEVSALTAVSKFRGVKYAALLYISDKVTDKGSVFENKNRETLMGHDLIVEITTSFFSRILQQ
jgi:uridine phosphorylase